MKLTIPKLKGDLCAKPETRPSLPNRRGDPLCRIREANRRPSVREPLCTRQGGPLDTRQGGGPLCGTREIEVCVENERTRRPSLACAEPERRLCVPRRPSMPRLRRDPLCRAREEVLYAEPERRLFVPSLRGGSLG